MTNISLLLSLLFTRLTKLTHAFQVEDTSDPTLNYNTYRLFTAKEIGATLRQWQVHYPDFIKVTTSQDAFGLPTAGNSYDCPFDSTVNGCLNYYAVVQDSVAHPEGSASSNRLPTVLLSGELHGNERVGPTAVMEAVRLLLEAGQCESFPRYTHTNSTAYEQDLLQAQNCRERLSQVYGMTKRQQQWLARLLKTRRILLVPTANAVGYYRNTRQEGDYDPNRDFPYDQLDGRSCMRTIAARTLNELYRHYLITNSFTFHGGTELLGYEWGNPSHYGTVSPDDIAQDQLAQGYVTYGGSFLGSNGRDHPNYLYGDMNSIIYYVRGGFEDYAYAGSWDTEHMKVCTPNTHGGYDASKTIYDDGMLRSFNMLVETSWVKVPNDNDMGTTKDVLYENSYSDVGSDNAVNPQKKRNNNNPNSDKRNLRRAKQYYSLRTPRLSAKDRVPNGHIPRNLRLAIASIDLTQPYLKMTSVNNLQLTDDLVPLTPPNNQHAACKNQNIIMDATDRLVTQALKTGAVPVISAPLQTNPTITWSVGGAISIDETDLWVAVLNTSDNHIQAPNGVAWLSSYLCGNHILPTTSVSHRLEANAIQAKFMPMGINLTGTGFFSPTGAQPQSNDSTNSNGPLFSARLDLTALNITQQTTLVLLAGAKVDSSWTELPNEPVGPANTNPQSHMVQGRTNDTWFYENNQGYVIQGQSQWFSNPILLHLVDNVNNNAVTQHHNDRVQNPSQRPDLTTIGNEEIIMEGAGGAPTSPPTMAATEAVTESTTTTEAPTTELPTTSVPTDSPTDAPTTIAPTNSATVAPTTSAPTESPTESLTTDTPTEPPTEELILTESPTDATTTADEVDMLTEVPEEEELHTFAATATDVPSMDDGSTLDPTETSTLDPSTMDPSLLSTLSPTEQMLLLQVEKRAKESPDPTQSLADALRLYNRLTNDRDENPDLGGDGRRRQQEIEAEWEEAKRQSLTTRQAPSRAARKSLKELPPRP